MKYNKSEIMRRAWEIKKANATNIFGLCLKMAWEEAKAEVEKITREKLVALINEFVAKKNNDSDGYYVYSASVKDWANYGKSRTYFSVYKRRADGWNSSRLHADFGYFDNKAMEYIPGKFDLR